MRSDPCASDFSVCIARDDPANRAYVKPVHGSVPEYVTRVISTGKEESPATVMAIETITEASLSIGL